MLMRIQDSMVSYECEAPLRRMRGEGGRPQRGVGALPADCSVAAGLLVPSRLSSGRLFLSSKWPSGPLEAYLVN